MKGSPARFLVVVLLFSLVGASAACAQETPPTQKPGPEQGTTAPQPTVAEPAAPAAASPPAAPRTATSPAPARGEPTGRVVYGLDFSPTPVWLDPQENPALLSPYSIQYAVHDAMLKHMPGHPISPSLAESYEIATDFRSATFRLREGITFHNGEPVTSEDVKFTFENYRGANAGTLKEKTERIETPDARTVRFVFSEPFLDFLILYGTPASGAGWIVPKTYYEQVGPDGFKQNPIGAGPYKFVRQAAGAEIELEAFTEYWRKTPSVKTLILRGQTEGTTRVAALQTGEADLIQSIPGELIETVRADPNLTVAPIQSSPFWIEMADFADPNSPFNDVRVRQAVSLALDRQALSDAETGGLSQPLGNWILPEWPGAITWEPFPHDLERAKQLMAEAGYPDGFDVEQFTPLPPFFSLAERAITQLRAVGIRTRLNQMERAAFSAKIAEGPGALPGIILNVSASPGDAASWVRAFATCDGASSRTCVPEIEEKFKQYEQSVNPAEREQLIAEIQAYILENHIFVPVYRLGSPKGVGPRIANPWQEIFASIPQYFFIGPYEDVQLKD